MPKIRLYDKNENDLVTKKSGILNLNVKSQLNKKDFITGKYLFPDVGTIPVKNAEPYDDRLTLEFKSLDNVNKILGVPLIPIEDTNDFYISTLNLNSIPNNNLNINRRFNENILSKPNVFDIKQYDNTSATTAEKYISDNELITQITDVVLYTPYKESITEDSFTSEFENVSVFDDINYNVKNLETFEIELDFTNKHDLYLTNTQAAFRSNSYNVDVTTANEDALWSTQYNFKKGTQQSITSHLLTNAYWNQELKRWEYNVSNIGHISTQNLINSNLKFPSNLTAEQTENSGIESVNDTVYFVNNYIDNSFITTTNFNDKNDAISKNSGKLFGQVSDTFGFPKDNKWNPTSNHLIKLSDYISDDFEVEKIKLTGNISLKSETSSIRGNVQPMLGFNDTDELRAQSLTFSTYKNKDKLNNDNITTGVSFYLLDISHDENDKLQEKINFAYIHNNKNNGDNNVLDYENTGTLIDVNNAELLNINKYDAMSNNFHVIDAEGMFEYRTLTSLNNYRYLTSKYNIVSRKSPTSFYCLENINNITQDDPSDTSIKFRHYYKDDFNDDILGLEENITTIDSRFVDVNDRTYEKVGKNLITNINLVFTNNINADINDNSLRYDKLVTKIVPDQLEIENFNFNIEKALSNTYTSDYASEDDFSVRSNFSTNNNLYNDKIMILDGKFNEKNITINSSITENKESIKMLSETGKDSSYSLLTKNISYTLKPSSTIVFGVNAFNGFNSLLSYIKLKDKIKIKFYGKSKRQTSNESKRSSAIKKTLTSNLIFKEKKLQVASYNSSSNILDSVQPSIDYIFENYLGKQFTTKKDALNLYKENDEIRKFIFTENESIASDNVVNDWHKKYYFSKNQLSYKSKDYTTKFKYKDSCVYFDDNTYSVGGKIYNAGKSFRNSAEYSDKIRNSSYESSIKEYFVPYSNVNDASTHTGVSYIDVENDFKNENAAYKENTQSSKIIDSDYLLTLQPLNIPKIYSSYTDDDSRNSYETSWCLVYEFEKETNDSYDFINNIYENVKAKDPDHVKSIQFKNISGIENSIVLDNITGYDILYDRSFVTSIYLNTITSITNPIDESISEVGFPGYHNFKYLLYKPNLIEIDQDFIDPLGYRIKRERIHLVIPIPKNNSIYDDEFTEFNFDSQVNTNIIKNLNFNPSNIYYNNNHDITDFTNFTDEAGMPDPLKLTIPFTVKIFAYSAIGPNRYIDNSPIYTYNIADNAGENDEFTRIKFTGFVNNDSNDILKTLPDDYKEFYNKKIMSSLSTVIPYELFALNPLKYLEDFKPSVNKKSNFDVMIGNVYVSSIYKKSFNTYIKTSLSLVYSIRTIADVNSLINVYGVISNLSHHERHVTNENLLCGINLEDELRVFEPRLDRQNKQFSLRMTVPYFDVLMSQSKPFNSGSEIIFYPTFLSIKSEFLEKDTITAINSGSEDLLITHGTPITLNDNEINTKSKYFVYGYNNNIRRNSKMPFDKIEGYRFGVMSPTEKNLQVHVSTTSYGQFSDISYDTITYPEIKTKDKKIIYNVTKSYYDENYVNMTHDQIFNRLNFVGSNKDENSAHFYPFIESATEESLESLYWFACLIIKKLLGA